MEKEKIGIFRFYNYEKSRTGETFGMCAKHEKEAKDNPPPFIEKGMGYMEKISDDGNLSMNMGTNNL